MINLVEVEVGIPKMAEMSEDQVSVNTAEEEFNFEPGTFYVEDIIQTGDGTMEKKVLTQIIKIIFSQDGVTLKEAPFAYQDYINKVGKMLITQHENKSMVYVEWKIKTELTTSESEDKGWNLVNIKHQSSSSNNTKDEEYLDCIKIHLKDIVHLNVSKPNRTVVQLIQEGRKWSFDLESGDFENFISCVIDMAKLMKELYPESLSTNYFNFFISLIPKFISKVTGIVYPEWNLEQSKYKSEGISKLPKREGFSKLPEREICTRGQPLSDLQWLSFKNSQGKINNVDAVKKIIFKGGISTDIRREVWMYLLKYYKWENTYDQQKEWISKSKNEYYRMKSIWENANPNIKDTRLEKCRRSVRIDVERTDRYLDYFSGPDNPNLEKLFSILMTYCAVYNADLGYVQGMDTLLSPLLYLFDDEVVAFWCFVGFMNRTGSNFEMSQTYMQNQLYDIINLLAFLLPEFVEYLKKKECDHLSFCFRWLLVWFKRELGMENVMNLWEVLWTGFPCENFHLFICVALLESQHTLFMENDYGPAEILQHIYSMCGNIDVTEALNRAEAIYNQIVSSKYLPETITTLIKKDTKAD